MKQRLLAFDIETAKPLPEELTDLLSHRPLGITCAAAVDIEGQHEVLWHGRKSGTFAAQMSRAEAQGLVARSGWIRRGRLHVGDMERRGI